MGTDAPGQGATDIANMRALRPNRFRVTEPEKAPASPPTTHRLAPYCFPHLRGH